MPTDVRAQLQRVLGDNLTLQRELGGGGMSRVFLAHDASLGREVVVKLLHPDLVSGVNVERFKREIQLAASLQHPHIVPLLAAGEMDGVPWLTMPFVAGRSLRERLAEQPTLPLSEAVDILRDVARALAYAHGRGVIHRDIKPDNVLLAEGSATVTDFGIAKAVNAARDSGAAATLTSVGASIGTPAYMAPEQAAGDPQTDHRADIYAWGAMAWEVLAGRAVFVERAPHKLLAAHMSQAPEPVTDYRPDCPEGLARLVMQCLAKDPAARPESATELVRILAEAGTSGERQDARPALALATRRTLGRALAVYVAAFVGVSLLARLAIDAIGLPDWVFPGALIVMALGLPVVLFTAFVHHQSRVAHTVVTHTPGGTSQPSSTMTRLAVKASPHVSWRRTTLGGIAAVAIFVVGVVAFMGMRAAGIGPAGSLMARGALSARDQIIVADFHAPEADSSLGTVVGEAVRVGLGESRAVRVMPASQVAAALGRMQRSNGGRLDHELARELAQREGAKAVVDGEVTPLGQGFIVSVRLRDAATDDELASFRETADSPSELIPAIDRATRALRGKIGESLKGVRATPSLAQVTTASLPALRKYTEAFRAHIRLDYSNAIPAYEEAIRIDSTFAIAYRQLAIVYGNQRARPDHVALLATRAYELRDRLPEVERLLVEATFHGPNSPATDRPRVIAAYERVLEIDPENASAHNNLAVVLESRRDLARAESLLARGRTLHPGIGFFWSGLARMQLRQGRTEDALRSFEEYRRQFPDAFDQSGVSFAFALTAFGVDSLLAACRRAERSRAEAERRLGVNCLRNAALVRGQLNDNARLTGLSATLEREAGNAWTRIGTLDSAFVDIWYRENSSAAVRRLDQYVARTNLLDAPRPTNLTFRVANLYSWAGRPDRARAILDRHAAEVRDTARLRIESTIRTRAEGEVALAEKRYDDAIRLFWKGDTLYDGAPANCVLCALATVARAYDLAGQRDSAIAVFERYVAHPFREGDEDGQYLAGAHKRLAELYDAAGNVPKAVSHYATFVELWKNADPELQPRVAAARKRLAVLAAREGR